MGLRPAKFFALNPRAINNTNCPATARDRRLAGMSALKQFLPVVLAMVVAAPAFAQDWAKAKLEQSPRHREYVTVQHDGRSINTYVAYPEVSGKAPVVILIHEIFGLSDWMKLQADELAAKGYIVMAPDLLSGLAEAPASATPAPAAPMDHDHMGANGTGTIKASPGGMDAFRDQDSIIKAIVGLDAGQVNADLGAVADYGKKLPSANGKIAVAGFCWGGGKSFAFATYRPDLSVAFVFYGPPPSAADMAKIKAPVYGFYAGNDARISSTIPQATADMKAAGKSYDPVTYDGAGHGFMRAGQAPDATPANKKAFDEGFARMTQELQKIR